MCDILKNSKCLKILDLSENTIQIDGFKYIAKTLRTNSTLTALNLSHSLTPQKDQIPDVGASFLWKALSTPGNTTLSTLIMCYNSLGEEDMEDNLGTMLQNNTTLTVLDLQHNLIGDHAIDALTLGLAHNTTLKILKLQDNDFEGEDITALLEATKDMKTLTLTL